MLTRIKFLIMFTAFSATVSFGTAFCHAQASVAELQNLLRDRLAFDKTDLTELQKGQTVVKLLPVQDKREVAVSGVVGVQVPAQVFLDSFRESMATKSNPAILEIGRFSNQPQLDDLNGLTFETRDLEDLKTCVVGDCQLKLSAGMIERLRKEIDWDAPNYSVEATQLLKLMLLDYVRDYSTRGDAALIEYCDKEKTVRLAEEQRALEAASYGVFNNSFTSSSSLTKTEDAILWSKMKLGLKPVIAINHITIYKGHKENGPQILVLSKQIYANHYFNSSLAWTALIKVPGAGPISYLIYENRSRADGLGGPFGGIKRGIVADKAVSGLTAILEQSKARLNARTLGRTESASPTDEGWSWRRWKIAGVRLFFCLFLISAFAAFLALSNYRWHTEVSR